MKTLLLVIPRTFSVRAFLMTAVVDKLSQSAQIAVLSPYGEQSEFVNRFKKKNVTFYRLPDFPGFDGKHAWWRNLYSRVINENWNLTSADIEKKLAHYYLGKQIQSNGFSIKQYVNKSLIKILSTHKIFTKWIREKESSLFAEMYDLREYKQLFSRINPDIIISTKSAVWDEYPIARLGKELGIPQLTYVLSFDNITTDGVFPVTYQKWLVWNEINKNEVLHQYPNVRDDDVVICGPLQFDFYHDRQKYLMEKATLFERLELDLSRPLLLLGAGSRKIADQELHIASQIAGAIREEKLQKNPQLLIRLHPDDTLDRWKVVSSQYPEVKFSLPWEIIDDEKRLAIPTDDDIRLLASTLAYSDIVINTSSSMALDAACFDRPVICLAYDDRAGKPFDELCRLLYEREHYVPITNSGGVKLVINEIELMESINRYLEHPEDDRKERLNMLNRYDSFRDGKAGLRTANAILDFLHDQG